MGLLGAKTEIPGYIIRNEKSLGAGDLNGDKNVPLREVDIIGKHVVIEAGNSNKLFETYNAQRNIKILRIYADTLLVKSGLHLPKTNVEVYARFITFIDSNDNPAYISTEPANPPGQVDRPAQGDAADGLQAGDLTVMIESVVQRQRRAANDTREHNHRPNLCSAKVHSARQLWARCKFGSERCARWRFASIEAHQT